MGSEPVAARRNGSVLVEIQWLAEKLIDHVVGEQIYFRTAVEQDPDIWRPFMVNQFPGGCWVVAEETAQIQFPDIQNMRARGEVELNYGWLVVDTGNKSYFRIEVFLGDAMSGVDVEPVIGIGQPATHGSIVAAQA